MTYHYTKLDDGEGIDGQPRYEIDDIHGFTVCIVDDEDTARLFCAAPDLLEAAELAAKLCALITKWGDAEREESFGIMDEIFGCSGDNENPREAVAKAKGI
jgi:hypothetical protein